MGARHIHGDVMSIRSRAPFPAFARSAAVLGALFALGSCAHPTGAPQPPLSQNARALRFKNLVNGDGAITNDATIIVDGDHIVSVGSGDAAVPRGVQVVDLRKYTAIPGLIDVHTHMTYWWDHAPGTKPFGPGGTRRTPAEVATVAMENARLTLDAGVTTVRDLGSTGYADMIMRDRINRGEAVGPRMYVAGYGLSKTMPRPNAPLPASGSPAWLRGRINTISEIALAVKTQADSGADVIKMYGSTGTGADTSGTQTFAYEEMKAAVDAAHALGKRIAIHSYGPNGGRDAVRAGTNTLEHSVDLDDATLALMVRQGTIYVPTIDHNRYYADFRADYGYTDDQARGLDAFRARNTESARRAIKAGVKVAMGSDAVHMMFGQNTRELERLVEAGMTPLQALRAGTVTGAEVLGLQDRLGRIAPGFAADIVAVEGDPAVDVKATVYGVKWVMKAGVVTTRRTSP
jgi:imidazolonepropionase-like amidohydrolase